MKSILIRLLLIFAPDILDAIIHALQTLAHRSDNQIDDKIVAQIIINKDKIIQVIRQK